ncbi:uncharacterized protein C8R40DRAFT_1074192 [Lentinula edodes]|uniref:uncharacterized protein n=1 Tax=Lentinula edodes TaxID=5353 RepID=UPI001E8E829B|nr:uncharacterized protein C8R40DRAFT_1074192 [Lentinula edodes]KAH7869235.1 hypothetical protein C8R40DRAFT_1074192 [Lentinula edodes]
MSEQLQTTGYTIPFQKCKHTKFLPLNEPPLRRGVVDRTCFHVTPVYYLGWYIPGDDIPDYYPEAGGEMPTFWTKEVMIPWVRDYDAKYQSNERHCYFRPELAYVTGTKEPHLLVFISSNRTQEFIDMSRNEHFIQDAARIAHVKDFFGEVRWIRRANGVLAGGGSKSLQPGGRSLREFFSFKGKEKGKGGRGVRLGEIPTGDHLGLHKKSHTHIHLAHIYGMNGQGLNPSQTPQWEYPVKTAEIRESMTTSGDDAKFIFYWSPRTRSTPFLRSSKGFNIQFIAVARVNKRMVARIYGFPGCKLLPKDVDAETKEQYYTLEWQAPYYSKSNFLIEVDTRGKKWLELLWWMVELSNIMIYAHTAYTSDGLYRLRDLLIFSFTSLIRAPMGQYWRIMNIDNEESTGSLGKLGEFFWYSSRIISQGLVRLNHQVLNEWHHDEFAMLWDFLQNISAVQEEIRGKSDAGEIEVQDDESYINLITSYLIMEKVFIDLFPKKSPKIVY